MATQADVARHQQGFAALVTPRVAAMLLGYDGAARDIREAGLVREVEVNGKRRRRVLWNEVVEWWMCHSVVVRAGRRQPERLRKEQRPAPKPEPKRAAPDYHNGADVDLARFLGNSDDG